MAGECGGNRCGKSVAVDRKRAAGGHLVCIRGVHDDRSEPAHFGVQEADGVVFMIVGTKRIRTNQLGITVGFVDGCRTQRPHFMQDDRNAGLRQLPGRLGPGEAAPDDMNGLKLALCHSMIIRLVGSGLQWW
jgi:hypothetical protein